MERNQIHQILYQIAIIGLVFTLPFDKVYHLLFFWVLVANFLVEGEFKAKWDRLKTNKWTWFLLGFLGLLLISMTYTSNAKAGWATIETMKTMWVYPLIFGSINLSRFKWSQVYWSQLLSTVIASLYCLVTRWELFTSFEDTVANHGFRTQLVEALGIHHGYLSTYILFSILILLAGWFRFWPMRIGQWAKWLMIIPLILYVFMLGSLSSRMPLAGFFGGMILVAISYGFHQKKVKATFIGVLLIVGAAVTLYFGSPRIQYVVQHGLQTSYNFESKNWHEFNGGLNLRLAVWKCARKVIEENALVGVGIGDAKDVLMESYAHYKFEFAHIHRLNTHNNFLDFWVKAGLFGLLYFVAYLLLPFVWSFKNHNYLAMAFLVLIGTYCMTENFFSVQKGICFFSLFVSLYLCLPNLNQLD